MNAIETQILTAYETLGMSVEDICDQLSVDEGMVGEILWRMSAEYRKKNKIGEEDLAGHYKNLALNSPVDSVRERALRWLIDESKGRNDIGIETLKLKKQELKLSEVDVSLRIAQFNESIKKTKAVVEQILTEV